MPVFLLIECRILRSIFAFFQDFLFPSISFSDSRTCPDACMPLRADHAIICSIWPFFHLFQQGGQFSETDFSEIRAPVNSPKLFLSSTCKSAGEKERERSVVYSQLVKVRLGPGHTENKKIQRMWWLGLLAAVRNMVRSSSFGLTKLVIFL